MFSAFARFPDLGRGHAVPAVTAFAVSNHDERASNAGYVVHRDRSRPVCQWRPDPTTGKPVCGWEIDGGEAACAAEPVSGCTSAGCSPCWLSAKRAAWSCGQLDLEQGAKHGRGT
jgi:hypothetical protein